MTSRHKSTKSKAAAAIERHNIRSAPDLHEERALLPIVDRTFRWADERCGFKLNDTIASVLSRHRGIGPGFDILRIGLAAAVFLFHVTWLSGGQSLVPHLDASIDAAQALHPVNHSWSGIGRLKTTVLPMFFALSGFLIMGSAARLKSPLIFIAHRVLRIFPALIVEISLSALVLGPLLTEFSLKEYFSDSKFYTYLLNCFGIVTYKLPGLFLNNPVSETVNRNLWTLPSELDCYLIAFVLMVTSIIYSKRLFSVVFLVTTGVLAINHAITGASASANAYPLHVLTYYFFVGIFVYHWQNLFPARLYVAIFCLFIGFTTVLFSSLVYFTPIFLTLGMVYIGILQMPRVAIFASGDYSYGIYLYGFPICQAIMRLFPGLRGHNYWLLVLGGLTTFLFAVLSWHLVEKRVLALRKYLPKRRAPVEPSPTAVLVNGRKASGRAPNAPRTPASSKSS